MRRLWYLVIFNVNIFLQLVDRSTSSLKVWHVVSTFRNTRTSRVNFAWTGGLIERHLNRHSEVNPWSTPAFKIIDDWIARSVELLVLSSYHPPPPPPLLAALPPFSSSSAHASCTTRRRPKIFWSFNMTANLLFANCLQKIRPSIIITCSLPINFEYCSAAPTFHIRWGGGPPYRFPPPRTLFLGSYFCIFRVFVKLFVSCMNGFEDDHGILTLYITFLLSHAGLCFLDCADDSVKMVSQSVWWDET